ncbi:sensor histidine kinase YesM [Rhabdobacter roseus]|uniref:Sensor histidine kinase YesM n=1 Tax=Rhabdobacter roseus TaxID=1655419 RepID=A0A840TTY9_9BACT|nr:histidine kinase [Rhabdobacter roseus]MBB5285137.1 sensor histidine kinase YesM [Rhabdobacter roseus]
MISLSPRRYVTILTHVLIWSLLGIFLLLWQPLTWNVILPTQFWIKQAFLFSLLVAIFYINALFGVPRLLLRNRIAWFVVLNLLSVLLVSFLVQRLEVFINMREYMERAYRAAREAGGVMKREDWLDYFSLMTALMVLGISTSLTAVQNWQKDMLLRQTLEREKINSELSFLKAQINPHFFFNTLNNIYALTVVDVEAARESLHNLSRMMRYVLYETQQEKVMLSHEIDFVQDYIKLMKLRLTEKVVVQFEAPTPLSDVPIAPMLLLPFIENAFKHGVSAVQASHIVIVVRQQGNLLQLEVRNTLFNDKKVTLDESNGIGLVNTRRRLDLLYPSRYTLEAGEKGSEYVVNLKLNVT